MIVHQLKPPYYAVIFSSIRAPEDEGYEATAQRMVTLAMAQPGFLGIESARENGLGITVCYWESEQAILAWKQNLEHQEAQDSGRARWYEQYRVRVARVERDYGMLPSQ